MDASMLEYLPAELRRPEYLHKLANGSYVHMAMFTLFGPDADCNLKYCPVEWSVYQYRPSINVNMMFIALYGLLLVAHAYLGVRWRNAWFSTFMMAGCLFEMLGYVGRVQLYYNPWHFPAFLLQAVFITAAPVFFTASIYVTISKTYVSFFPRPVLIFPQWSSRPRMQN